MKYEVEVVRICSAYVQVDAESEEEAKKIALDMVDMDDLEFCDVMTEAKLI